MPVLAALATTHCSEEIGPLAISEARKASDTLTLLLVTERDQIREVYKLRSDPILQGTRTLEDLLREIELEHRRMLEELALAIEDQARAAGVEVDKRAAVGDYAEQVRAEAERRPYRAVFWMRHNRSFIGRFFLGDGADLVVRTEPDPSGRYPAGAFGGR